MSLRLGIDLGGTNTDAVLLRDNVVVGHTKHPTSTDVISGIQSAIKSVMASCKAGGIT